MQPKSDFWKKFQDFLGDNLPPILILILKQSGYDHSVAIRQLNEDKLNSIEQFARENLANILQKDNTYRNSFETFRFLPGHRATLLALPDLIDEYISVLPPAPAPAPAPGPAPTENSERNRNNTDTVDFSSEEYKDQLKKALKTKLEKYGKGIFSEDFILPIENLGPFEISTNRANVTTFKCIVKCSKCDIKVPCTFNKHWQVSNLQNHLKKNHGNERNTQQPNNNISHIQASIQVAGGSNINQRQDNSTIVCGVNAGNADEINKLIDSAQEHSAENSEKNTIEIPLSDSFENVLILNSV